MQAVFSALSFAYRISSFFSRIAATAAQAGQSQYFPPAALISSPCAATFFAISAPNTCAPVSDFANAISPSTGMISASSSATYAFAAAASPSVPIASSHACAAAFASAHQEAAFISSFVFSITYSLPIVTAILSVSAFAVLFAGNLSKAAIPVPLSPPAGS